MNSKHKKTLDTIINGVDTPLGKAFDVLLIWSILFSSLLLILDSVASIHAMYGALIQSLQTIFLVLFSIEFALRLYIAKSLKHYLFSFYGAVDFFAIAPIYLSYLIPDKISSDVRSFLSDHISAISFVVILFANHSCPLSCIMIKSHFIPQPVCERSLP